MAIAVGKAASAGNDVSRAFIEGEVAKRVFEVFQRAVADRSVDADIPTHILMADRIRANAERFQTTFRPTARHMYAVKANPDDAVLRQLYDSGITSFDVASAVEIAKIRALFGNDATLYFMHPRKADSELDFAFSENVKGFVADSERSLAKILNHPSFDAAHHSVVIRIQLPKKGEERGAALPLDDKFGAQKSLAMSLLQRCAARGVADIGMSFHVGSQMLNPLAYGEAIDLAASYAHEAGVQLTSLDVGGGFPAFEAYPHLDQPLYDLAVYARNIEWALARNGLKDVQLITEPGRSLVADAGYLVTRVMEVDDVRDAVYLNDGTYGSLFDAGDGIGFTFPVAVMDDERVLPNSKLRAVTIQGVTCDSCDRLTGEWMVPASIKDNDFVVFGLHGAYSQSMRSDFNGFGRSQTIVTTADKKCAPRAVKEKELPLEARRTSRGLRI